MKWGKNSNYIILNVSIFFITSFFLIPVIWQVLTSIKTSEDISTIPNIYFPKLITFEHYVELFKRRPFVLYIFNSIFVSTISTIICLVIGSPAAYILARINIHSKNLILILISIVSLFPYVLLFLGLLETIRFLNLGNNYLALIIPYSGINLPLTILIMRSFFQKLPKELEDAARIDGYKIIPMLTQILLPLTFPALVTTGILTFIFTWNEYIFSLTFITRETMKTIPVATAQIGGSSVFEIPYGPISAATVLGTFPLILLVFFIQKRIVAGLTAGAVKG